jgi:hypothetical protein
MNLYVQNANRIAGFFIVASDGLAISHTPAMAQRSGPFLFNM